MSEQKQDPRPGEAVGELVSSALKLSAAVVQTVAEAATGKPQVNRPGDTPLQSMIRHGTTAASSILTTVMSATREGSAAEPAAAPVNAPPRTPRVARGSSLRLPLSVDNLRDTVMQDIEPRLVDAETPTPLHVSFKPEKLTIAPNDFEKLTVRVDVPEDTPPGRYTFAFTLPGQETQPVSLSVEVV
jgi:hypothetical protein